MRVEFGRTCASGEAMNGSSPKPVWRAWRSPEPMPSCRHRSKYRQYYGAAGACSIRYDNERGKGDHRPVCDVVTDYVFTPIEQLLDDFRSDVERCEEA